MAQTNTSTGFNDRARFVLCFAYHIRYNLKFASRSGNRRHIKLEGVKAHSDLWLYLVHHRYGPLDYFQKIGFGHPSEARLRVIDIKRRREK